MSLVKFAALAAAFLSISSAFADDAKDQRVVGAWQPLPSDVRYADRTALVFSDDGRFEALVADGHGTLDPASGSWMLAEDGGELVLAFDNPSARKAPGTTRYLQMLLLDDELRPYSGMADRSTLAETAWRRVEDASVDGSRESASR